MIEVKRLVAGEAILSEAATIPRSQDELLEDIVRQHSRLVYRIAYALLRSHHDAEDATQETFLRVLRYRHKLAAVDNQKSWLARIAWRVAVDRAQSSGGRREITLDDPGRPIAELPGSDVLADQRLQSSQIDALVQRLIAALPKKLREPLILSAVEDLWPHEVAATLGISEAAVRSRVFRARQILRERLAGQITRTRR